MPNIRTTVAAMVLIIELSSTYAVAADHDVQHLYKMCKMPPTSPEFAICVGYISGVGDTLLFMGLDKHRNPEVQPFAICGEPSYGAMVQAFVNWAEKNPKEWARGQIIGAMLSLNENWSCKSN